MTTIPITQDKVRAVEQLMREFAEPYRPSPPRPIDEMFAGGGSFSEFLRTSSTPAAAAFRDTVRACEADDCQRKLDRALERENDYAKRFLTMLFPPRSGRGRPKGSATDHSAESKRRLALWMAERHSQGWTWAKIACEVNFDPRTCRAWVAELPND